MDIVNNNSIQGSERNDLNVWIPYNRLYSAPYYTVSFSKVRLQIKLVLESLGIKIDYFPVDDFLCNYKTKNLIFVNNLTLHPNWYSSIKNMRSCCRYPIYYGVTEGLITNPPSGFKIIVPSNYVAEECERVNLPYEAIIHHGFDPNQFNVDPAEPASLHYKICGKKPLFYSLGQYDDRKGYNELFEAIRLVKKEIGNKFMVYIRTGRYPIAYQKLKDIKDVVIVNDGIYRASDYEIALEMLASNCYLAPSHAEGFGMSALESAYACGKPVIYPNMSPFTDYLDPEIGYAISITEERLTKSTKLCSYRMRYWDIEEFSNAMIRVIENQNDAKKKGAKAYKNRSKWTIYTKYKKFIDFFEL